MAQYTLKAVAHNKHTCMPCTLHVHGGETK